MDPSFEVFLPTELCCGKSRANGKLEERSHTAPVTAAIYVLLVDVRVESSFGPIKEQRPPLDWFPASPHQFENQIHVGKVVGIRCVAGPDVDFFRVFNRVWRLRALVYLYDDEDVPATSLATTVV